MNRSSPFVDQTFPFILWQASELLLWEMLKLFGLAQKGVHGTERSPNIFTLLLVSGVMSVLHHPQSVLSQSSSLITINSGDFVCYMQMVDGRVVNLNKLCSVDKEKAIALSKTDQQFLERYQSLLKKRSTKLPSVQTALSQAQQNPQAVLQRAQAVCTALRTGEAQSQPAGQVGDDLFVTMAPKYYCPDLDD